VVVDPAVEAKEVESLPHAMSSHVTTPNGTGRFIDPRSVGGDERSPKSPRWQGPLAAGEDAD
jgi:hypothetical protein